MQHQQLSEDQRALRDARLWVYSKASQLQADKGYNRAKAVRIAKNQYRLMLARCRADA